MPSRLTRELRHSQNFLKGRRLVDRLLDRSSIAATDLVLEIGPGRGRITERLIQRCRHVLAIEQDPRLAWMLRERLPGTPNLTLVEADFLATRLPRQPYKVFANIPF